WRGGPRPSLSGRLRGSDVALDWGSVRAKGLQADLDLSWKAGQVRIRSHAPLTLAELDVGFPITDIRLGLESDLRTWHFHDIRASLLGGKMLASDLNWPSSTYQPVVLTGIEVARLA